MAEQRRILTAKRGNVRKVQLAPTPKLEEKQQGTKRSIGESKNRANDRLKRLRLQLTEEVKQANVNTQQQNQKRLSSKLRRKKSDVKAEDTAHVLPKLLKNNAGETKGNVAGSSQPFKFNNTQENIDFAVFKNTKDDDEMEWAPCEESSRIKLENAQSQDLFIVVDTNIFLSNLDVIRAIITMKADGPGKPVLYIPWIVIEELDFIKEDSNNSVLRRKAQEAIRFINATLSSKNVRMRGETLEEVNAQTYAGKSQDNKIISCCSWLLRKHDNMFLLTNDINLRNKAHINNIPVCSKADIIAKIKSKCVLPSKQEYILNKMNILCASVIKQCAMKAYGPVWSRMDGLKTSPKCLKDCLNLFKRYWFPVFQEDLMKQSKKAFEELDQFLGQNPDIKDDSELIDNLLRLCVRVCLFLKDIPSCKELIERTIRELGIIQTS